MKKEWGGCPIVHVGYNCPAWRFGAAFWFPVEELQVELVENTLWSSRTDAGGKDAYVGTNHSHALTIREFPNRLELCDHFWGCERLSFSTQNVTHIHSIHYFVLLFSKLQCRKCDEKNVQRIGLWNMTARGYQIVLPRDSERTRSSLGRSLNESTAVIRGDTIGQIEIACLLLLDWNIQGLRCLQYSTGSEKATMF